MTQRRKGKRKHPAGAECLSDALTEKKIENQEIRVRRRGGEETKRKKNADTLQVSTGNENQRFRQADRYRKQSTNLDWKPT